MLKHRSFWRKTPTYEYVEGSARARLQPRRAGDDAGSDDDGACSLLSVPQNFCMDGCSSLPGSEQSTNVDLKALAIVTTNIPQAAATAPTPAAFATAPSSSSSPAASHSPSLPSPLDVETLSSVPTPDHRRLRSTKSALNLASMTGGGDSDGNSVSPRKTDPNLPKRNIKFSSTVRVCLVPTRDELKPVVGQLYFRPDDYTRFKAEAVAELREVLTRMGVTSKQAIVILYQPQGNDYYKDVKRSRTASTSSSDSTDEESHSEEVGPSLSDDDEDEVSVATAGSAAAKALEQQRRRGPRREHSKKPGAGKVTLLPSQMVFDSSHGDDGPNLSEDEDEKIIYKSAIDNKTKELKFITNAKTDIELNAEKAAKAGTAANTSGGKSLPIRTPGGGNEAGTVWYSKWQKSANPASLASTAGSSSSSSSSSSSGGSSSSSNINSNGNAGAIPNSARHLQMGLEVPMRKRIPGVTNQELPVPVPVPAVPIPAGSLSRSRSASSPDPMPSASIGGSDQSLDIARTQVSLPPALEHVPKSISSGASKPLSKWQLKAAGIICASPLQRSNSDESTASTESTCSSGSDDFSTASSASGGGSTNTGVNTGVVAAAMSPWQRKAAGVK